MPISDHTNRILKRIFALNPSVRISLKELRREIMSVKTFVMSENELKNATRATKEAARAFGQTVPEEEQEEDLDEEEEEDLVEYETADVAYGRDEDAQIVEAVLVQNQAVEEDIALTSPPVSPSASRGEHDPPCPTFDILLTFYLATVDDDKTPSPSTPTGSTSRAPMTPPATPRRAIRPPALNQMPARRGGLKSSYSTDGSHSGSSAEDSDASSSDTLASDDDESLDATPRARRQQRRRKSSREVFSTPPQQARSVFGAGDYVGPRSTRTLPPSPVTPSSAHRRPRAAATRSVSPRAAAAAAGANSASRRTRKTSVDSSSSSSGASNSQPPTPTGPPPHHYSSHQPHIYDASSPRDGFSFAKTPQQKQPPPRRASAPVVQTAYYPLFADWQDVAQAQQSHYQVQLPPPVFLPAFQEDADDAMDGEDAFEFPMPPQPGYYTRAPAEEGQVPIVDVREAAVQAQNTSQNNNHHYST